MTTTPILNGPPLARPPAGGQFPVREGCLREGVNQSARCSGREQRLAPSMDTGGREVQADSGKESLNPPYVVARNRWKSRESSGSKIKPPKYFLPSFHHSIMKGFGRFGDKWRLADPGQNRAFCGMAEAASESYSPCESASPAHVLLQNDVFLVELSHLGHLAGDEIAR